MDEDDDRFFRGLSDELAPFELPVATWHSEPGHFPWVSLDEAGQRLVRFAHRFGSYDWSNDPRQDEQAALLRALASGRSEDPVDGDDEFLWHCLFAVVRADRFNEGLVAENLVALTRIANELRRRLLRRRGLAPRRDEAPTVSAHAQAVTAAHPEVIRDSAESYLTYLESLISSGTLGEAGQAAAHALRQSLRNCLAAAGSRRVEVPFTAGLLARCTPDERTALVNQWSLGIGNDSAPVVLMGTEHAYDVQSSPAGLALESCGSALLWLNDSGPELAEWIAQDPKWVRASGRSYHRHPYDHFSVGSGHTWRTVARVLRVELSDLGERTYQIERSAHPARASLGGVAPTTQRREFLVRLLRAFRPSARVLVLHGRTSASGDEWEACNRALTLAFLNADSLAKPDKYPIGKAAIRRWTIGDRTVFHTWALNGGALAFTGAGKEYEDRLADLVAAALRAKGPDQPSR